jgi:hypothetical protein
VAKLVAGIVEGGDAFRERIGAGIARDEAQPFARAQRQHPETQFEDELAAAGVTGIPLGVGPQVGGATRRRREPGHSRLRGARSGMGRGS